MEGKSANILVVSDNDAGISALLNFLQSEGHVVTTGDFIGGAPSTNELATINVVLVSRATNSGNYDEGVEPLAWNSLDVPIIMMAPHLMRANRWGWVDGSAIQSITGGLMTLIPFQSRIIPLWLDSRPML